MKFTSKNEIYHIKTTGENGRSLHVFLKPNPLKKPQLDKALKNLERIGENLADYGQILASCYGRFPTADIRKKMREDYNFDC